MRCACIALILAIVFACPVPVSAADFNINVNIMRQEDGTTCGELWLNDKVLWRLTILTDGAKPTATGGYANTTLVTPDIVNGMFVIKVQ